ncbi:MAG: Rrf2 family transcriptional regulator [Acidiferrobacterales bacterium]|nr:Rrf2 family transcriptional regulator [Acidiferrobacterales bacterium]
MKLTTKGRYAVTAMMDLALHQPDQDRVSLKSIAEHQEISIAYLEQLFAGLKAKGLVSGVRGPGGGYRLTKPADEISIYEIISAVDESVDVTRCHGREDCQDGEICLTHELWTELSSQISGFLDQLKLGEIIQSQRVREVSRRQSARCESLRHTQQVVFN